MKRCTSAGRSVCARASEWPCARADKRRERKRSTDEDTDDDDEMLTERELAEGVTERTVAALRKLAKEGLISRDQKRRLLTDVIRHHQQGEEASEVEIAYELLVMRFLPSPESDEPSSSSSANLFAQEEEDLLEDFADQVCVCVCARAHACPVHVYLCLASARGRACGCLVGQSWGRRHRALRSALVLTAPMILTAVAVAGIDV